MKRLYFLTNNIDSADQISEDMHAEGITDWRFHILSKDSDSLIHRQLHSATALQSSNIVYTGERGAITGGLAGLLACLILIGTLPASEQISNLSVISITAFCVILGGVIGTRSGRHEQHYKIAPFRKAIDQGMYLIIVDIRRHEELRVRHIMQHYHPDVTMAGIDSPFTNPFASTSAPLNQP